MVQPIAASDGQLSAFKDSSIKGQPKLRSYFTIVGNHLADKSIEFKQLAGKEQVQQVSYKDRIDFLMSTLDLDSKKLSNCGGLKVKLSSEETFLSHDANSYKLTLTSQKT